MELTEAFRTKSKNRYPMETLIYEHYMLDHMQMKLSSTEEKSISRQRLQSDVLEYSDIYHKKAALLLRDYLLLAGLGECMHATVRMDPLDAKRFIYDRYYKVHSCSDYRKPKIPWSLESTISQLHDTFNLHWLSGGYGGPSWAKIIKASLKYGTLPDKAFVNHAINLMHNTGAAIDKLVAPVSLKSIRFCDKTYLKDFLDQLSGNFFENGANHLASSYHMYLSLSPTMLGLVERMQGLSIHTYYYRDTWPLDITDVKPLVWGKEPCDFLQPEHVEI